MDDQLPERDEPWRERLLHCQELIRRQSSVVVVNNTENKIRLTAASLDREKIKEVVRDVPKGVEIVETTASRLRQEGFDEGVLIGKSRGIQIMLEEILQDRFGVIHPVLVKKIEIIESADTLKGLFRQALKVESIQEFNRILDSVLQPL